jgi:hypothetical protein
VRSFVAAEPDARLARMDEPEPRLDASRPSGLRAAGFLLTAVGGFLIGLGAVGVWLTVGIPGESAHTSIRGTDLPDGRVAFVSAVLVLVSVVTSRLVRSRRARVTLAILALIATLVAAGWGIAFLATGDERSALVQTIGIPKDLWVRFGVFRDVGLGVWLVVAGGILGATGAVLTLSWARRAPETSATAD